MENFISYNPTKLIFGKGSIRKIGKESSRYGTRALLLIGKGSVKKNGILDQITDELVKAGTEFSIYEGIKSNPVYQDADEAVAVAKEFRTDMIIAVGGGSVIDSAKAIAMGYFVEHSIWDFYTGKADKPQKTLPILCVLTLAATGSEMNPYSVIQNDEEGYKASFGNLLLYPKTSFLVPEFTYSVPPNYTAYGVADLISHAMEAYFDTSDAPLSNHIASDIIKLAFEYGRRVMAEPESYEARANIMWLATMALNGTLDGGKRGGDWGVHNIEHSLSVLYDIPHGAGLSVVYPAWLKHFRNQIEGKLDFLATRVLGEGHQADDYIQALEDFYTEINTPIRLSQAEISREEHPRILENLKQNKANGYFFKMTEADYQAIINLMA